MESKLFFWGHNCFLIDNDDHFLVTDPWLSDKGAFSGSWFQYPKNHHLQDELLKLSRKKKGYIFITHEHQDHFDLETLLKVDKSTQIIIPAFKEKFLLNSLKELGFECIELRDMKNFSIDNFLDLKLMISDVGVDHDSAILIETDSFTFFNQNDCRVFDRLSELNVEIDFYSVQFSGANHHPSCYINYTQEEQKKISEEKILSKLNNVSTAINLLQCKYFVPGAGPAIFPFLDPNLSLEKDNIFIHQPRLDNFLRKQDITNILYPRVGDEISSSTNLKPISGPSLNDLNKYKENLTCVWNEYPEDFDEQQFIKVIQDRLDEIQDIAFNCDAILVFKWDDLDGSLYVDLENKKISKNKIEKGHTYILKADKKYFYLMSSPKYRWQDISLTLRAHCYRNPDEFSNIINLFLFSEVENIRQSLMSTLSISDERIIVKDGLGQEYEINRFCPHQGADLTHASINEAGQIICPRHGWKFCLKNSGDSLNGRASIHSKLVK